MDLITLPILGTVTLEGGIISIILFIIGYVIGSGIKSALKYGLIFVLFLAVLAVLGYLPENILQRVVSVFSTLKPLVSEEGLLAYKGAMNLGLLAFVSGFVLGLVKG